MIEVRVAQPHEYEEAGRITALAYREFIRPGDPPDWWDYLDLIANVGSRADRTIVLVAVEGDQVRGSVTLELEGRTEQDDGPLAPDEAHIRMLGVDPAARRIGVARMLMEACEARARESGKHLMTLHTTERMTVAQAMYASMGYVRSEDLVFPDGFTLWSYSKTLDR